MIGCNETLRSMYLIHLVGKDFVVVAVALVAVEGRHDFNNHFTSSSFDGSLLIDEAH